MVDLAQKYDVLTGAKKTRKFQVRLSEILYSDIKEYLYIERKEGQLSEIVREFLFNLIITEHGTKFILNPLWKEQERERQLFEASERFDKEIKILEQELVVLKNDDSVLKFEIHPKYPIIKREVGKESWLCEICEQEIPNLKGIHFHKCVKSVYFE